MSLSADLLYLRQHTFEMSGIFLPRPLGAGPLRQDHRSPATALRSTISACGTGSVSCPGPTAVGEARVCPFYCLSVPESPSCAFCRLPHLPPPATRLTQPLPPAPTAVCEPRCETAVPERFLRPLRFCFPAVVVSLVQINAYNFSAGLDLLHPHKGVQTYGLNSRVRVEFV